MSSKLSQSPSDFLFVKTPSFNSKSSLVEWKIYIFKNIQLVDFRNHPVIYLLRPRVLFHLFWHPQTAVVSSVPLSIQIYPSNVSIFFYQVLTWNILRHSESGPVLYDTITREGLKVTESWFSRSIMRWPQRWGSTGVKFWARLPCPWCNLRSEVTPPPFLNNHLKRDWGSSDTPMLFVVRRVWSNRFLLM